MSSNKLKELEDTSTRSAYCKGGTDLVVYCLGLISGDITEFKTTVSPETADAGRRFLASLQTLSTSNQDKCLQDLFFSLFSQKRYGDADKYSFPAYSFLVPYSYTEHGNLLPCNRFSRYFSMVVFFARASIFNNILETAKCEGKGPFE